MTKVPKLDQIDFHILAELQRRGRIDNQDLASLVGLSPSPCLKRVRALEASGYINGYHAELNLTKLGDPQVVFTQVTLENHRHEDFLRFENALVEVEELREAHLVSGGFDYLLKFMTRDIAEYQKLMDNLLGQGLGITKYFSFLVLKSPILKAGYPLGVVVTPSKD
jgi:DNA-binding Lrp family transcriptional regulator